MIANLHHRPGGRRTWRAFIGVRTRRNEERTTAARGVGAERTIDTSNTQQTSDNSMVLITAPHDRAMDTGMTLASCGSVR